jgi:hypothetical protein
MQADLQFHEYGIKKLASLGVSDKHYKTGMYDMSKQPLFENLESGETQVHDPKASARQMSDFCRKYAAVNVLNLEVRKLG